MTDHNPFAVAERLAPVPASRDQATTTAWTRHYAALALAAFATFDRETRNLTPNPEPGSRPDIGYLCKLGVASMAAAHAHVGEGTRTGLWDLTPEAGALNGEWEEWLTATLDRLGINPADIDPRYTADDFRSPTAAVVA